MDEGSIMIKLNIWHIYLVFLLLIVPEIYWCFFVQCKLLKFYIVWSLLLSRFEMLVFLRSIIIGS